MTICEVVVTLLLDMSIQSDEITSPQPDGSAVLTIRVLGGLELRNASGDAIGFKSKKGRLLLAYLAVPKGIIRTREQLASFLWSDRQEEQARSSLRTALSTIRQAIGEDALIVEGQSVSLRPDYIVTDYAQLRTLVDESRTVEKLEDFYSGEFLAGFEQDGEQFIDWLRAMRNEAGQMAIQVLEGSARAYQERGDNGAALNLLRESLSLEPLKEQTHRQIMELYAASGERAMALAQFRTCKELLLHELGVEPDPATLAVADIIATRSKDALETFHHTPQDTLESVAVQMPPVTDRAVGETKARDGVPSIAVLPFVNMSGDAEQNYFAEGITEDIITDLSEVDALSIAAKSSSQMYRGVAISPSQIAEELGVRYILEGSVRKSGDSVRISAQLIDGPVNLQIWAERYDRRLENIFVLQSEISQAIVGALEVNLASITDNAIAKRTTNNVETYEYYLRGRSLLRETSKHSIELARELFGQAISIDPDYALAYTGLADCATVLLQHYDVAPHILEEALANCDKALQLNPKLAEAYAARGYFLTHLADRKSAEEHLVKAVSLAPKMADAHYYLGKFYLGVAGEPEKAFASFKTAFALDQELRSGTMLLTCLQELSNPEELQSYADQLIKIAKRRVSLNPYDLNATLTIASAWAKLGKFEEAKYWANVASAFDTQDGAFTYNLACAFSVMGCVDQALDQLARTLDFGCSKIKVNFMTKSDPDLALVRNDPRFDELVKGYWKHRARLRKNSRQGDEQR